MKISEIYRNIANVMDMCEGTNVLPHQCVRINSDACQDPNAYGLTSPGRFDSWEYTFAIAIIEDKPVFVGDELWSIWLGKMVKITGIHKGHNSNIFLDHHSQEHPSGNTKQSDMTWEKPKLKTFTLNGTDIKMPDGDNNGYYIDLEHFTWKHYDDRDKAASILRKLLSGEAS